MSGTARVEIVIASCVIFALSVMSSANSPTGVLHFGHVIACPFVAFIAHLPHQASQCYSGSGRISPCSQSFIPLHLSLVVYGAADRSTASFCAEFTGGSRPATGSSVATSGSIEAARAHVLDLVQPTCCRPDVERRRRDPPLHPLCRGGRQPSRATARPKSSQ